MPPSIARAPRSLRRLAAAAALAAVVQGGPAGCASTVTRDDAGTVLRDLGRGPDAQVRAAALLEAAPPDTVTEDEASALDRAMWAPGFRPEVRVAALDALAEIDPERARRSLRRQLPRMEAWEGLVALCDRIADLGWTDLTPALASSWSRRVVDVDDADRPERGAIVRLHGEGSEADVLFDLLESSTERWQQGLRTRVWTLLHRLGERDRLAAILRDREPDLADLFLVDLRAGLLEMGILPRNREEILWVRSLQQERYADFRTEAAAAVAVMPESRRLELELRDVPLAVAAARHDPHLLDADVAALRREVASMLEGRRFHVRTGEFDGADPNARDRFGDWDDRLTWGDLAAIRLALLALDVPQVAEHLFDHAERDRADETTEYGGVIALDEHGRFEVLEFLPRIRRHDRMFVAPQTMLDEAYDAAFHYHFHAQSHRNGRFAGPGEGDLEYAANVRANCLVFTFLASDRMNVDWYRHGRVQVDLGEIRRPRTARRD